MSAAGANGGGGGVAFSSPTPPSARLGDPPSGEGFHGGVRSYPRFFSSSLLILPTPERGRASTNSTFAGTLYFTSDFRQ